MWFSCFISLVLKGVKLPVHTLAYQLCEPCPAMCLCTCGMNSSGSAYGPLSSLLGEGGIFVMSDAGTEYSDIFSINWLFYYSRLLHLVLLTCRESVLESWFYFPQYLRLGQMLEREIVLQICRKICTPWCAMGAVWGRHEGLQGLSWMSWKHSWKA